MYKKGYSHLFPKKKTSMPTSKILNLVKTSFSLQKNIIKKIISNTVPQSMNILSAHYINYINIAANNEVVY